jgi:hypothetical protein
VSLQVAHHADEIAEAAPEAIEPPDDEAIPCPQRPQAGVQLKPGPILAAFFVCQGGSRTYVQEARATLCRPHSRAQDDSPESL